MGAIKRTKRMPSVGLTDCWREMNCDLAVAWNRSAAMVEVSQYIGASGLQARQYGRRNAGWLCKHMTFDFQ